MRPAYHLSICLIACLWCASTDAQIAEGPKVRAFLDGNDLLQRCESGYGFEKGECEGYVMAIADALTGRQSFLGWHACLDIKVRSDQVRDVVLNALRSESSSRHLAAGGLVAKAIADAFPCSH
jgi:hypothetical protein